MLITVIVPRLPPSIDGLGDYAFLLASQLCQEFGIQTHFIVGDPTWCGATELDGFQVSQVTQRSTESTLEILEQHSNSLILVHYVGYGYAKRGCPNWLIKALEQWKDRQRERRLVTMFHEIAAFGPPWRSSFWLSLSQRDLAARLAKISDHLFTNRQCYAALLSQLSGGKLAVFLPVFSNIGEPNQVESLAKRKQQLVVFGGCSTRSQVYKKFPSQLSKVCQLLEINKILDIGNPIGLPLTTLDSVSIKETGPLPPAEISRILSHSLAGFFNYPIDYLAKSGIFAAYCAHGVLPVSANPKTFSVDGIETGTHYWYPEYNSQPISLEEMQEIATNAHNWYQTHTLDKQAKTFAEYLIEV